MKINLILSLFTISLLVASCSKNNDVNPVSLSAHLTQYGDSEASTSPACGYLYWDNLETIGSSYDGTESLSEVIDDLTYCFEEHRDCLDETVAANGGAWNIIPVFTGYPDYIDFSESTLELEFKLYDVDNATFVSSPSSYVTSWALDATGLQSDLSYDNSFYLALTPTLSGDTYTYTIDVEDIENEHGDKLVVDFRLRLRSLAMPTISLVNTTDDYMYAHLPLVIIDNL